MDNEINNKKYSYYEAIAGFSVVFLVVVAVGFVITALHVPEVELSRYVSNSQFSNFSRAMNGSTSSNQTPKTPMG